MTTNGNKGCCEKCKPPFDTFWSNGVASKVVCENLCPCHQPKGECRKCPCWTFNYPMSGCDCKCHTPPAKEEKNILTDITPERLKELEDSGVGVIKVVYGEGYKYADAAAAEHTKEEAPAWEEEFLQRWPNTESGIDNYHTSVELRDFISRHLQAERTKALEEIEEKCREFKLYGADHVKISVLEAFISKLKGI